MKKTVFILFTVWTLCVLAACGGSQTGAKVTADGVDIDLTQMNATIMYAELSNIIPPFRSFKMLYLVREDFPFCYIIRNGGFGFWGRWKKFLSGCFGCDLALVNRYAACYDNLIMIAYIFMYCAKCRFFGLDVFLVQICTNFDIWRMLRCIQEQRGCPRSGGSADRSREKTRDRTQPNDQRSFERRIVLCRKMGRSSTYSPTRRSA